MQILDNKKINAMAEDGDVHGKDTQQGWVEGSWGGVCNPGLQLMISVLFVRNH